GVSLESITQVAANISDMNTQIASAAEEQSKVAEEINRNIVNISQVAGQTAQDSLRAASSNENFARLTIQLKKLVSHFKV
ncbi:MAG: chemotaxis protein, partial [Burkholderiales bacterium]|nr:chemotaxis protein [Burkholderiales bacterium]